MKLSLRCGNKDHYDCNLGRKRHKVNGHGISTGISVPQCGLCDCNCICHDKDQFKPEKQSSFYGYSIGYPLTGGPFTTEDEMEADNDW